MDDQNNRSGYHWFSRYHIPERWCIVNFVKDLERSGKYLILMIIAFFTLHNAGTVEGLIAPVVSVADIEIFA